MLETLVHFKDKDEDIPRTYTLLKVELGPNLAVRESSHCLASGGRVPGIYTANGRRLAFVRRNASRPRSFRNHATHLELLVESGAFRSSTRAHCRSHQGAIR